MEFCHLSYSIKYQVIHQMAFWEKVLCYCVLFCWLNFYMSYQVASWGKIILIFRSSPPKMFLGKSVLEICSKITGEHACRSVILGKLSWFLSLSIYLLQSFKLFHGELVIVTELLRMVKMKMFKLYYSVSADWHQRFNQVHSTGQFLYSLKISENLCFSGVFMGY